MGKSKRSRKYQNRYPLATVLSSKMKFRTEVSLTSAAGAPAVNVYRANDIGDPNATAIGHQPRGYDQIVPLYERSLVTHSKIRIMCQPQNAGTNYYAICLLDNATPLLSLNDYLESKYVVYKLAGGNTAHSTVTMSLSWDDRRITGVKDPLDDDDLSGFTNETQALTVQPLNSWFYHVFTIPSLGADGGQQSLDVAIDYDVKFHQPLNPDQS